MKKAKKIIPSIQDWVEIVHKKKILKKRNGKHYWAKCPTRDENRQPTANQLAAQERFKKCSAYAKEAIKDPAIKNAYEMMTRNNESAYNRAFSDAMHPPQVVAILTGGYLGRVGNIIYVNAIDDFLVKRVVVRIYKGKKLIEEGESVECAGNIWEYKATALVPKVNGVKIVATAYDMPGNCGLLEVKI